MKDALTARPPDGPDPTAAKAEDLVCCAQQPLHRGASVHWAPCKEVLVNKVLAKKVLVTKVLVKMVLVKKLGKL